MLNLHLKQAQSALSDGQLDEAFRLVSHEAVGRCRKGQRLVAKVAQALAGRGKEHLAAERLQQALGDCNKADQLGGNRIEVAELRRAICKRMEQKQFLHRQQQEQLDQAREKIDDGWLSVGEEILGDVEHGEADILMHRATAKRKLAEDVVSKAGLAIKRGDIEQAIDILRQAGLPAKNSQDIGDYVNKIRDTVVERCREYLNAGRIDLASALLDKFSLLGCESIETRQLADALGICGQAGRCIAEGKLRQAANLLARLKVILGGAKWVESARTEAIRCAEAIESLEAGPVGLAISERRDKDVVRDDIQPTEDKPQKARHRTEPARTDDGAGQVPSRFLLQIDGVGAFLVVRDRVVTIGPVSSSARPAVGLVASADIPVARIERHDDEYFLRSDERVSIGNRTVGQKLLSDGDKIALSDRCRMRFNIPNAASNTATLHLSSARMTRPDITSVILMDRDILVGPTVGDHIRTGAVSDSIAFFVRDGRIFCRTKDRIHTGTSEHDCRQGLPVDQPVRIGSLNVVIVTQKGNLPG